MNSQPKKETLFLLSDKNKAFRRRFEGEFSDGWDVSGNNILFFVDFGDEIWGNFVFRLGNCAADVMKVFERSEEEQMSTNESQIIELDLRRVIILIGIVEGQFFFSDHRITVLCFVVQRNHGESLLELTNCNDIAIPQS